MKNKGFTLIELLAVIVILAIIALIAVPIILNIIGDSKEESDKRSIEGYTKALENAIATQQLASPNEIVSGKFATTDGRTLEGNTTLKIEYDGNVVCGTIEVYKDGSFYLEGCKVNNGENEYSYGTKQETQVYKPQYYSWSTGNIGGYKPSDAKTTVSEIDTKDYPFYLGIDVDANDKVTAAYVCFTRNGTEYCFKGGASYKANQTVLAEASKDLAGSCSFDDDQSHCGAVGLFAYVYLNRCLIMDGVTAQCVVNNEGEFSCKKFY